MRPRRRGGQRPIRRPPSSPSRARIGVVFASHHDPEAVFRRHAGALLLLRGARVRYPRYTTAEQVGEALRQADIGLHDFGRRPDDALIAEFVLRQSEGLVAIMDPLLALVDGLARHNRVAGGRPTLALFEQALKGHARMVRVIEERANVPGGRRLRVVANGVAVAGRGGAARRPQADDSLAGEEDAPPASDAAPSAVATRPLRTRAAGGTGAGKTAAQRVAAKRRKQAAAQVEKRAMSRKRHPVLADVPGGQVATAGFALGGTPSTTPPDGAGSGSTP